LHTTPFPLAWSARAKACSFARNQSGTFVKSDGTYLLVPPRADRDGRPCRSEGVTGSPPGHCSSKQAPTSRPSGRYAVVLRPSLDPDAYLDVCAAIEDSPNLRSPKVLTRPRSFRDDLQ
jgi:hypothetical protein